MREKNYTLLLFLSLIFINYIDAMADRINSLSDKIVFPDEFEEIKAQEIFQSRNKQDSENEMERDFDLEKNKLTTSRLPKIENRNIIGAPSRCPEGYRPDPTGKCRLILAF